MTVTEKTKIRTIDCTPTWSSLLPALILALECGTETGKRLAREELAHMANVADAYVSSRKALTRDEIVNSNSLEANLASREIANRVSHPE